MAPATTSPDVKPAMLPKNGTHVAGNAVSREVTPAGGKTPAGIKGDAEVSLVGFFQITSRY